MAGQQRDKANSPGRPGTGQGAGWVKQEVEYIPFSKPIVAVEGFVKCRKTY